MFPKWISAIYLLVVTLAIFVCCLSIMTSTVRLAFGMARDNQPPASKTMAKVHPRLHTPIGAFIAVAVLSAIPFLQFTGATVVAVAATAMIYLSYFLGNIAVMRARAKGWPKTDAPFKLGAWGKPINVMLINLLWWGAKSLPRAVLHQPDRRPERRVGQLPHLHPNKIPLMELIIGVVVIVGLIYYATVGKNKEFAKVVPPEEIGI